MTHELKLKSIASNMTELCIGSTSILFSYDTPVAGWDDKGAFRTLEHYSATTTKHINKYLGGKDIGRGLSPVAILNIINRKNVYTPKVMS
jgi:hypothetical protein